MEPITLTTQLSEQDYIKVNFHFVFRKWKGKFMLVLGIFSLMSVLFLYLTDALTEVPWIGLIFGLYLTVGFPVQLYFAAKKAFKTHQRVSETIVYAFEPDRIRITGESFQSTFTWDKVYSLTETKDWVLIWTTPQVANVVPKRDFSPAQLRGFKQLAKAQQGPKNKLNYRNTGAAA
ncbi:YcxB family protein [Rufibacter psychrotolerans]|uniref:YcxB family protein n=1 Tax=Rufibacter psychrotolerans TaxID=2812556 RepID=UPI0019688C74|nr:YcxB family protein [Rufibacter sp. SYSU D00308]